MNKCKRCKYIPSDFIDEITYNKNKGHLLPVIHYDKVCKICKNICKKNNKQTNIIYNLNNENDYNKMFECTNFDNLNDETKKFLLNIEPEIPKCERCKYKPKDFIDYEKSNLEENIKNKNVIVKHYNKFCKECEHICKTELNKYTYKTYNLETDYKQIHKCFNYNINLLKHKHIYIILGEYIKEVEKFHITVNLYDNKDIKIDENNNIISFNCNNFNIKCQYCNKIKTLNGLITKENDKYNILNKIHYHKYSFGTNLLYNYENKDLILNENNKIIGINCKNLEIVCLNKCWSHKILNGIIDIQKDKLEGYNLLNRLHIHKYIYDKNDYVNYNEKFNKYEYINYENDDLIFDTNNKIIGLKNANKYIKCKECHKPIKNDIIDKSNDKYNILQSLHKHNYSYLSKNNIKTMEYKNNDLIFDKNNNIIGINNLKVRLLCNHKDKNNNMCCKPFNFEGNLKKFYDTYFIFKNIHLHQINQNDINNYTDDITFYDKNIKINNLNIIKYTDTIEEFEINIKFKCKICDKYDNYKQIINNSNDKYNLLSIINKFYNNEENKKYFLNGHTQLISNGNKYYEDNEPYNPYKYGYYDYSDRGFNWYPVSELYH